MKLLRYITGTRYIIVTVILIIIFFEVFGIKGILYLIILKIVFALILAIVFRGELLEVIKHIETGIWGKPLNQMSKGEKWKYKYRFKMGGKTIYETKRDSKKRS